MWPRYLLVAAFAVGMLGMSVPAFAESGVMMPRGPVLSSRDPVFMGMVLSPGFSKCKELRGRYQWKCTYGDVPADPNDRFGKKPKAKSATR